MFVNWPLNASADPILDPILSRFCRYYNDHAVIWIALCGTGWMDSAEGCDTVFQKIAPSFGMRGKD